ncbi:MAG: hypothetical protein CM15mP103_07790 [Gammaproteobacteria bacterium]|nr:MAG: hypothetical protein CM15mP103_07790 [Gammaproteobacteria bacterium]
MILSGQPDIIQAQIMWPGASPKEVELPVVQRVEEALKNVSQSVPRDLGVRESYGL